MRDLFAWVESTKRVPGLATREFVLEHVGEWSGPGVWGATVYVGDRKGVGVGGYGPTPEAAVDELRKRFPEFVRSATGRPLEPTEAST